jgi:4-amino-4-deoxy-L-arabinose transferase-like glycosyltransferase
LLAPAVLDETPRALPFARALSGWGALGLALLAKGPVALLVVLPPLLFAPPRGERLRRLAALRPIAGVAAIAILGAPWLLAVSRADLGGALAATAWTELPGRFLAPREGHSGFPGVHLVLAPLLAWPGSLGLPLAVLAVARALRTGERSARLLAFWVVPSWIVFELSATRLPHYTLPLLPALALGAAAALDRAEREAPATPFASGRLVFALAGMWRWGSLLAPPALVFALAAGLGPAAWAVAGLFAAVTLALHVATRATWRARRPLAPLAGALATACLGSTLLIGFFLPAHQELWLGPRVGVGLAELGREGRPLAAAGWCEESVLFSTGAAIERIAVGEAGPWLERNPSGLLVHETDDAIAPGRELERFEGFDYVRGRRRSLAISTGR